MMLCATASLADTETFHGWSKDGSWFVKEARGENDGIELYFCQSDGAVPPTWAADLNEADKLDGQNACVRFIDINKAPYQWKKQLVLPEPSMAAQGMVVSPELITDGESPGFVLETGTGANQKRQTCYAQGLRDNSKLQKAWFHPNGKKAAAQIDGQISVCTITLKGAAAPAKPGKPALKGKK